MIDAAERVSGLFHEQFGDPAELVWAAPGRVNLIGEHTDYNDGFVLPFALPHRTAVAASRLDTRQWVVWSESTRETRTIQDLTPGTPPGWAAYVAGVVWALRESGHDVPGARLAIASDVPPGAGLSSSAALECAVLGALADLAGLDLPIADRPWLAHRAEHDYVGVPCGILDQAAATLCRQGHALLLDCRTFHTEQVPLRLDVQHRAILVIDTRTAHTHAGGQYAERRRTCERAAASLGVAALRDIDDLSDALHRLDDDVTRKRVRHVVGENQRVLAAVDALQRGDLVTLGALMTESHASLRDDYQVSVPQLDTAVRAALDAGALGARMTGGGFGGCVLALVDADAATTVDAAVRKAFAANGFAEPVSFIAQPGDGAARVR